MTLSKIIFCNCAYGKKWFKNFERQNPAYFHILRALIGEIEDKDDGDIVKADLYARRPEIANRVQELRFDPFQAEASC